MQSLLASFNILELLKINGNLPFFQDDHSQFTRNEILNLVLQEDYEFIIKADKHQALNTIVKIVKAISINKPCIVINAKIPPIEVEQLKRMNLNFEKEIQDLGPGVFLRTSGTSSQIKNYFFHYQKIINSAKNQANALNILPNETIFLGLPLNHVSGLMLLFRAIVSFSQIRHSSHKFSFFDIDHLSLVPAQLDSLIHSEESISYLKNLKSLLIGGSALQDQQKEFLERNEINSFESYGATETLGFAFLDGKKLEGIEFVQNKDSTLTLFSDHFPEYKLSENGIEKTHFVEKGLILNDIIDVQHNTQEETSISFKKRKDLVFQVGSENFDPLIYENFLKDFLKDQVHQFLFLPFPDKKLENIPILVLITNKNFDAIYLRDLEKDIVQHLKKFILPFLMPKNFIVLNLPEYFQEKIGRQKIIKMAQLKIFESCFDVKKNSVASHNASIFFHGFMGNHHEFDAYQTNEHSQYFLTLPWHSEKSSNTLFNNRESILFYLNYYLNLLSQDHLCLHLVGYSMGGRLLLHSLDKALVSRNIKIFLLSTNFGLETIEEKNLRIEKDMKLFESVRSPNDFRDFLKQWYSMPLFSSNHNQSLATFRNYDGDTGLISNYQYSLNVLGPGKDPLFSETILELKRLGHFHLTLINGEFDSKYIKISLDALEFLKRFKISHKIIKNAYHDPHRSHVSEITQIINFIPIPD